ncbi:MAG: prepilin-type N-terminal cleavage/methylation domain-containing protein [Nitrospinota bacterium]|nr:prepilin-type N-terminal cleavage/methylation domain-containing protein [Nitrospinota bacterium]
MPSLSTLLQENLKLNVLRNDRGFSLLEVIVALLIMAGGFLAVVNLFSGSVRSVNLSSQYLKAVTLANSKMNELEIENFFLDDKSGGFKNEENYRWELEIAPYDSNLNNENSRIQLQKILLKVFWNDNGKPRKLELATLRLDGQTYPVADKRLKQIFKGGAVNISTEGLEETTPTPPVSTLSKPNNISGSVTPRNSSSSNQNISGN